MNKRLFLFIIAFFSAIANSFALIADRLEVIFDRGGLIDTIIGNPYILGSLFYIVILLSFQKIFALAVSPIFRGNRKEANFVGFSISFIGTSGIFYMFSQNGGIEYLVSAIGGYAAFLMIFLALAGTIRIIDQVMSSNGRWDNPRWRASIGMGLLLSAALLSAFLIKMAIDTDGEVIKFINDLLATIMFIGIVMLLTGLSLGGGYGIFKAGSWGKKKYTDSKEYHSRNPEVKEARKIIGEIENASNSIKNSFKKIAKTLGK